MNVRAAAACARLVLLLLVSVAVLFPQDHPLLSPYPGSKIQTRSLREFDQTELPLGPNIGGKFKQAMQLEGKITAIKYNNPAGRSTLEIIRNYRAALGQAGFQILFACDLAECGKASIPVATKTLGYFNPYHPQSNTRYLAAKLERPAGDVYVAIHVTDYNPASTFVNVIEVKPMQAGLVSVNAAALAGDIGRAGHVAVYGIYFDTDKAEVKPESEAALREIAKLVESNARLKLHVVGHTDNVGPLLHNMDLSRRRADAVVKALTTRHGVSAALLHADGVGPLAPVATNQSEEGRAKNRRVELVEQ